MPDLEASPTTSPYSETSHCNLSNTASAQVTGNSADDPKLNVVAAMTNVSESTQSDKPSTIAQKQSILRRLRSYPPVQRISTSVGLESADKSDAETNRPRTWRTTWLRLGPLSGIFCMLLACASFIASFGILAGYISHSHSRHALLIVIRSNGQLVEGWSAPPSTYIAIFTALANLSVRYAAFHGIILAWWYRATQGATLGELHWDWSSGSTVRGALYAFVVQRHVGLLGLACLFSTVAVIDGPLLQRASTVTSMNGNYGTAPLNVSMMQELPTGSTGGYYLSRPGWGFSLTFNESIATAGGGNASNLVFPFDSPQSSRCSKLVSRYAPDIDIWLSWRCRSTLRAPAMIPTVCTSQYLDWDFGPFSKSIANSYWSPPLDHLGLAISTNLVLTDRRESISLLTGYGQSFGDESVEPIPCVGTINLTICTLEAGIAEYAVTIQGDTATLDAPATPTPIALANNTRTRTSVGASDCPGCYYSTLAGLAWQLAGRYETNQAYYEDQGILRLLVSGSFGYEQYQQSTYKECPKFSDPRPDVMAALNKLMVYYGQSFAQIMPNPTLDAGVETNTTITGVLTGPHSVFTTDYTFFAAAAIVEFICIALIAPTYWKYWTLGRPVSFSPLEIAKAFESPMLAEWNSNSTGRDLARAASHVRVRYGAVSTEESGYATKVAFSDSDHVKSPQQNSRFAV